MLRIIFTFVVILFTCQSTQAQVQDSVIKKPAFRFAPYKKSNIVGILGAFPEEVRYIMSLIEQKTEFTIRHTVFVDGILKGQHVVVALTGIGKVNAAMTTILMIELFEPKEILFTGIAGAVNPDLSPGDLVIGKMLAYHDFGMLTPEGLLHQPTRNPFTMKENPEYFRSDSSLVKLAEAAGKKLTLEKISDGAISRSPKILTGTIVTGDIFVASETATKDLRNQLNAEATEMEGAAVAQVCHQQKVPFLVIRSMSDNAGSNAQADVKNFYHIAARNSATFLLKILEMSGKP